MKYTIILMLVLMVANCSNEKNIIDVSGESYRTSIINLDFPYLFFDSKENPVIIIGQAITDSTGREKFAGDFGKISIINYNKNNEKSSHSHIITDSSAVIDVAFSLNKNNDQLLMVWLDPRNNPDFRGSYIHTYFADIYYKIIDIDGSIIENEKKITDELHFFRAARDSIQLDSIYDGKISDMNCREIFCDTTSDTDPRRAWIHIDSKEDLHLFKVVGLHETKIIYSKFDKNRKILIPEKELFSCQKSPENSWSPGLFYWFFAIDSYDNIHCVWTLHDADAVYHYMKLTNNGEIIINEDIGTAYN